MKPSFTSLAAKFKFSRSKSHRDAMLRNLTSQVLQHNCIITTETKCAAVQEEIEKCITFAKKRNSGSVEDKKLYTEQLLKKVFFRGENHDLLREKLDKLATETYKNRSSGFTRIIRLEPRQFDKSPQSMIELVGLPVFNKETGDVIKGNMKLWLLCKTLINQEEEEKELLSLSKDGGLKKLTLQNFNKIIKSMDFNEKNEFFNKDLLKMKILIKKESNPNQIYDENIELLKINELKEKLIKFNEFKELDKLKFYKNYNKVLERPDWQKNLKNAENY